MKKLNIKIYNDKGVGQKNLPLLLNMLTGHSLSFISAKEIKTTSWENGTDWLIIPGGMDLPYHRSLKGEGNKKIKKFVENGGNYLGVCAGAYFGCSYLEFDIGQEYEVVGPRELAFFPGGAIGPAYGNGTFVYDSEEGAQASLLSNPFFENFRCYFNGGCYFKDVEKYANVEVISRYMDIEDNPAAIIKISVGKGTAVLSGPHIEVAKFTSDFKVPFHIENILALYETHRTRFFRELLNLD